MNTTIKIWKETRKKLRLIAALTDENMVEVIDRLASHELLKLQKEQHEQTNSPERQ